MLVSLIASFSRFATTLGCTDPRQLDEDLADRFVAAFSSSRSSKTSAKTAIDYVLHGRPSVPYPQVFLCLRPPVRPMRKSSTVAAIVRRHLERCGLQGPRIGAHLLRHSLATRMVRQDRTLEEVADLLGHRHVETTTLYAKVALSQLAEVALPFPGGGA